MLTKMSPPSKSTIIIQVCVILLAADFEIDNEEPREMLLTKIAKEFLTLKGFARTEEIKQSNKNMQ